MFARLRQFLPYAAEVIHVLRAKHLPVALLVAGCALATAFAAQNQPRAQAPEALQIDLKGAMERARNNSPQLQSAELGTELAREDRRLARTTLLPTLNYLNQYIYTQGNGTPSGVFVANDGVHIYNSQAVVHQDLYSPARLAEYRRAFAAEKLAAAKKDIGARGLASTVIQNYYELVIAQRHGANARQSLDEARRFTGITEKLEKGGEVARSDVVKAQLTLEQRQRDVLEAELSEEKAKVALAVLLFPDYRTDFIAVDDLGSAISLPELEHFQTMARQNSPELRAAEETVRQEELGVDVARGEYFPSLTFDYFFGINSNQFTVHDPEGRNRLGSVAQATLNFPVFNWGATRIKIRQAELRRRQAQLELDLAQKQFQSNLRIFYLEAKSSLSQLETLKRSLDLSLESLRLTGMRYESGEASVLEVVDAQTTLAQARNAYDDGLARCRLSFASLQTLIGIY